VNPAGVEEPPGDPVCSDGLDNDCDGATDLEEPACVPCTDLDGDGYGNPGNVYCTYPEEDCDDMNEDVYPGAPELCDGVDNQCPGDFCHGDVDSNCAAPGSGMVTVPCGCFDMGDSFDEGDAEELPVHHVCISTFEMDAHEVTNAEYRACVDAGPCTPPTQAGSATRATYYGDPAYDDFPVIYVGWYQAESYCAWAEKRLPTEAEWEYAARGGLVGKRYPKGDTISGSDANYIHSGDPWDDDTSPVAYFPPNGYGLYDMDGNVGEWVNDWYQRDYYAVSPTNDPPGPASGGSRVLRGGGWSAYPVALRVAYRHDLNPIFDFLPGIGIRCAR